MSAMRNAEPPSREIRRPGAGTAQVVVAAAISWLIAACTSSRAPMALMQKPDAHFLCRGGAAQVRDSISAFLSREGMVVNEQLGVVEARTPVETVRLGRILSRQAQRRIRFQIQLIPDIDGLGRVCHVNIFGEFEYFDGLTRTPGFPDSAFALASRLGRTRSVCRLP